MVWGNGRGLNTVCRSHHLIMNQRSLILFIVFLLKCDSYNITGMGNIMICGERFNKCVWGYFHNKLKNHDVHQNSETRGLGRIGKFLNFFNVITFSNNACVGAGGLNGTCYTQEVFLELKISFQINIIGMQWKTRCSYILMCR